MPRGNAAYSIVLDVSQLNCVVVGAGAVGERKALGLIEAGAIPRVIGRKATARVQDLARSGRLRLDLDDYKSEKIGVADLVIAATDDPALNRRVASEAKNAGALVNVVDDPSRSDFANVSQIAIGDLRITVGTLGRSPAFTKALRKYIESVLPDDLDTHLGHFERWRGQIDEQLTDPKDRQWVWSELDRRDLLGTLFSTGKEAADRVVDECLGAASVAYDLRPAQDP